MAYCAVHSGTFSDGDSCPHCSASRLPARAEEPVSATDIRRVGPASCEPPVILDEHLRRVQETAKPTCANCGHSETSNTCAHCGFDPAIDISNLPTVEEMKGLLDKSIAPIPSATGCDETPEATLHHLRSVSHDDLDDYHLEPCPYCAWPQKYDRTVERGNRSITCVNEECPGPLTPERGEDKLPSRPKRYSTEVGVLQNQVPGRCNTWSETSEDEDGDEIDAREFVIYADEIERRLLAALKENARLTAMLPTAKAIGPEYLRASREHFKSAPVWHPGDEEIEANIVDPFYVTNYAELLQAREENTRIEESRTREKNHLSQCLIMASVETNDWRRRALKAEGTPDDELPQQFDHLPGWLHGGKIISDNRERCMKFTRERAEEAEAALTLRDEEIARVLNKGFRHGDYGSPERDGWNKALDWAEAELARLRGEK